MECGDEDDYVTSVAWAADGKHVAVGTSGAAVQIWDAARGRQVRGQMYNTPTWHLNHP